MQMFRVLVLQNLLNSCSFFFGLLILLEISSILNCREAAKALLNGSDSDALRSTQISTLTVSSNFEVGLWSVEIIFQYILVIMVY